MSTPSCNSSVTATCLVCGRPLAPGRRDRTTCSDACRQAAWRLRHQEPPGSPQALPPGRSRKHGTVYQCPECDARQVGVQHCECGAFMRRLGPGGYSPCCGEAITVEELLADQGP